jgi:hypothetical protein
MALEQIKLDNLTWAEMVTTIRRRIPAASGGDWTLHAPVDPGVTLLELFAYLLEQRVYWLDQIPDSLVHAALSLMGETVKPATPAATVLRFSARAFEKLNGLTQVRLVRSVPPLVFSTDEDVLLLPVDEFAPGKYRVGLYAGIYDRTLDLTHERRICLLPSDATAADVTIVLWLTEEAPNGLPGSFGEYFSLFFQLDAPEKIRPQWLASSKKDVPTPAELSWWYPSQLPTEKVVKPAAKLSWWYPSQLTGKLEQFPADAVHDGTRGLRRSGIVRLKVPADWRRESFDPSFPGLWPYSLTLRIEESTFTSPPVLRRLVPNVVIARHRRQTKKHTLLANWLPLPDNRLALSELDTASIQDHPALEDSVELSMKERDGEFDWEPTQTFTFRGPGDRVFTVDREKGLLRFGDGLTGRVPVVKRGVQNVTLSYFVGGGEQGNIGSGLSFEGLADTDLKATNLVPAEGGAERESLEVARRRAAAALRRVDRAITGSDHETVVLSTPGVAFYRAYAALGHHPAHPCRIVPGAITVYVVPEAPRSDEPDDDQDCAYVAAPKPDQGALQAAREFIEKARLIGSEVFVEPVEYRAVSLAVVALGDPTDPRGLNERVRLGLRNFLDPLRGGTQKNGWPFGEPLRPSVLLSEAQRAAGPGASIISIAIGLDGNEPSENCRDVEIEPHQLVVLCEVVVRLQADVTSQGGLR